MPQSDELPDAIKNLARRQGIEISHNHFESDVERLIDALVRIGKKHRRSQPKVVAARGSTLLPKSFGGIPLWLFPAVIVLVVIARGAAFQFGPYAAFNEQFGLYEKPSRLEEKAELNSNVLKMLPPPQTTSTVNIVAPSSTASRLSRPLPLRLQFLMQCKAGRRTTSRQQGLANHVRPTR
jgi:hypothetical protein